MKLTLSNRTYYIRVMRPEELERVSDLLFGRSLRVPLAAHLFEHYRNESFYQQQVADEMGTRAQYLQRELAVLTELDMIRPEPKSRGEIRQMYKVNEDNALWTIVETTVSAVEQFERSSTFGQP